MAILNDFKTDIFISYAHIDNDSPLPQPNAKGWVDSFHHLLKDKLTKRLGSRDIAIWGDPAVRGNDDFNDVIKDQINQAGLFLALTSPGYLSSDYCKKELFWFKQKAEAESQGLLVAQKSRIFNLLLYNIDHNQWPEAFKGTSGFSFHDAQYKNDYGEPVRPNPDDDVHFNPKLRELVEAIIGTLEVLNRPFQVYLADVSDDLVGHRNDVMAGLENQNIELLPTPQWFPPEDYERSVIDTVEKADLSIHLFRETAGRVIEGGQDETYPQKQANLALASGTQSVIWIPKTLNIDEIEDPSHRAFLSDKKNRNHQRGHYEFVAGTRPTLTQ